MTTPSGLGGITSETHIIKDNTPDLVASEMVDRVEPSQLGGTIVEVFSIEDTTPGLISSGVVVHSKLEDISSLREGNMTYVDLLSLIITLEPHKTSNGSKFDLEILPLFCQNLANEEPSSVQSFTTRANAVLTTAWVEGAQLDHYTALFRDIEKSLIQLEKVPDERAAHDARVAMEEASLFSLRQDLAKMRDDIVALTEKADEFATEIIHREGLLSPAFVDPSSSILNHIYSRLQGA